MGRWVSSSSVPPHIGDVRAFCTVVSLGSISAAARQLAESKGSVSRRITRLERTLGVTLLRRNNRIVGPTERGAAYHSLAAEALEKLQSASTVVQLGDTPSGTIRIAVSHGFGIRILAPLLASFIERFPKIQLEVMLTDKPPDLNGQEIDLAIYPANRLGDSSLIATRILSWSLKMVATPSYLAQNGVPMVPKDLEKHRIALGSGPSHPVARVVRIRRGQGRQPERILVPSAVVSMNVVFNRELALTGSAIGFLPDFMVENDLAEKRLVEVLPDCLWSAKQGNFYLLYPATRFMPPKIKAFRDFVIERLAKRSRT